MPRIHSGFKTLVRNFASEFQIKQGMKVQKFLCAQ